MELLLMEVMIEKSNAASGLSTSVDTCTGRLVHACKRCPRRVFPTVPALIEHIEKCHMQECRYTCSGLKQWMTILAIYDSDMLDGVAPKNLLARSAECIRSTVWPPLSGSKNNVNDFIRLILDGSGPRFVRADQVATSYTLRRLDNIHYSLPFAHFMVRELLLSKGRLAEALRRYHARMGEHDNLLGNIFPMHGKTMWGIVHDIFSLSTFSVLKAKLLHELYCCGEFESLSMDCTVKVALLVMGQPTLRHSGTTERNAWQHIRRGIADARSSLYLVQQVH